MSRELLAFLLSELNTVRIVCRGKKTNPSNEHEQTCGAILEVSLAELETIYQRVSNCPVCGNPFGVFPHGSVGTAQDGFRPLYQAIENLGMVSNRFTLEFVLPQKKS